MNSEQVSPESLVEPYGTWHVVVENSVPVSGFILCLCLLNPFILPDVIM